MNPKFEREPALALQRLQAYWQRIGFRRVGESSYYVRPIVWPNETRRDLEIAPGDLPFDD